MPGRNFHGTAGFAVGSITAFNRASHLAPEKQALEALGGGLGGYGGGRLPDWLEPARHPGHRDFFHSHFSGLLLTVGTTGLDSWQDWWRQEAFRFESLAEASKDSWNRFGYTVMAFLCWIASGFLPGLVVGYMSHLALDAFTPRSLPVVGKVD